MKLCSSDNHYTTAPKNTCANPLYLKLRCAISRSSHWRCSNEKGVLRNLTKFTGKHLCQSLFFNKVAGLRPTTLLKKRLRHRCFPVNFPKFLRTSFLQNTPRRLLLNITFIRLKQPFVGVLL